VRTIWWIWIWEGFLAGAHKVLTLWWLIPFFVVFQLLTDSGWLARLSRLMNPVLRPLRLPGEAAVPMVGTVVVGLTYGSGMLIQAAKEGKLSRNELTVICVTSGICHAVIEETVLFAAAGTSGTLVLAIRVAMGLLFGYGASYMLLRKKTAPAS
jgi:hypothetical protein